MRSFAIVLIVSALALTWGCGPAEQPSAESSPEATPDADATIPLEDIHVDSPDMVQELFRNDWIHVAAFEIPIGETLPMHRGGERTVYSLTDYTVRFKHGERENVVSKKAGTAHWHAAEPHEAENVGDTPVRAIIATRTLESLPGNGGAPVSLAVVAPEIARVLLDNGRVQVYEVTLPAGAEIPAHIGMNRLVIARGAFSLEIGDPETAVEIRPFSRGDLYWAQTHSIHVRNAGEQDAVFVVIEFKN